MNKLLKNIEKQIIVSCQASKNDPLAEKNGLISVIKSVINGGALGLRLAGRESIKKTRKFSTIPIIGITKPDILPQNWKEIVYITPSFKDAKQISDAGADIIAIDGTLRQRPNEKLEELIFNIKKKLQKPVMADISTYEEALICAELGADIISTTLSGYTSYTLDKNNGEPDFELLETLVNNLNKPVILEGRIWTPEHAKKAFESGAFCVVIGSAITRPQVITERFIKLGMKSI
ncbi:MAG TPA: N-acetylmannosamine-6-phosphate 2-epimerase [Candidatus Gastranaerophilales bacterium]|nr:N-acetylmannosamine-6-phosphate 2-epimerase [Candidatus Gastranaerophilales bacterium]